MDDYFDVTDEELNLLCEVPCCGCGLPEQVYDLYRAILRATPTPGEGTWDTLINLRAADPMVWWLIVYSLDHIGATDHGGTVEYAWRTEKGDRLLDLLDRYAEDYGRIPAASVTNGPQPR